MVLKPPLIVIICYFNFLGLDTHPLMLHSKKYMRIITAFLKTEP